MNNNMSDFNIDIDFEAELAGIRGQGKQEKRPAQEPQSKPKPAEKSKPERHAHGGGGQAAKPQESSDNAQVRKLEPEPEGFEVRQSQQESLGGSGAVPNTGDGVGWKKFKTLPGIFEHVGGDRPVRLNPNIKRSQVSGIPEPMLGVMQAILREEYTGASLDFPWGRYDVTANNRVFTTKSTLIRYLLFDGLRDAAGTHVQYAKQWLALQHPAFDVGFKPETHLSPTNDELDIYALLYIAHTRARDAGEYELGGRSGTRESEQDLQTAERLGMLNMGMARVLDKLNEQAELLAEQNERQTMLQTVLLLDRLGLLKGGLPKDMGEFVRVLEQNRDAVVQTGVVVDNHVRAESERKQTLARQERMRQMQARGGKRPE